MSEDMIFCIRFQSYEDRNKFQNDFAKEGYEWIEGSMNSIAYEAKGSFEDFDKKARACGTGILWIGHIRDPGLGLVNEGEKWVDCSRCGREMKEFHEGECKDCYDKALKYAYAKENGTVHLFYIKNAMNNIGEDIVQGKLKVYYFNRVKLRFEQYREESAGDYDPEISCEYDVRIGVKGGPFLTVRPHDYEGIR